MKTIIRNAFTNHISFEITKKINAAFADSAKSVINNLYFVLERLHSIIYNY